jgi:hypothetical protein
VADWLARKFRENSRGFWKDYRWFLVVFVFAVCCDAASTIHFMLVEGPDAEIHVAIRYLSRIVGPIVGPLFGAGSKILAGIIVGIYCRRYAGYIFAAASIISLWAAWYNLWGFRVYTPMILRWFPW